MAIFSLPGDSARPRVPRLSALAALPLAALTLFGSATGLPGTSSSGTVSAACGSFQSMVNAASSGGTITVPACTYHEAVTVGKSLTIHASGVVIDGDHSRGTGLAVTASDVAVDGLTVINVAAGDHRGAVWTTGASRFTFRNGAARDSSPICISLNGGSGHRILDSEFSGCRQEGYFGNGISSSTFARNNIHHNNLALAYDWNSEAGGGKVMASSGVTFDANEVAYNRGPGIWFDSHARDMTVSNNRLHHNDREGVFFEISNGASIAANKVWENGWGYAAWGYGAGITIASSDNANVHDNTVAWNARGISVISQNRNSPPHVNNIVHDNTVISTAGSFVAGFYDDHGGSLYTSSNNNHGYGGRYWIAAPEPSGTRFVWSGGHSTLSGYNSTRGEEGGTNISTAARDVALANAGIPADDGTPVIGPPRPGAPALRLRSGTLGSSTVPGYIAWPAVTGAAAYQLQIKRDTGSYATVTLSSSRARSVSRTLSVGHTYRARVRVKYAAGIWSGWTYSSAALVLKPYQETNKYVSWSPSWTRSSSAGASGGYVRFRTTAGAISQLTFAGRSVAWVAPKSAGRGSAEVYIDGVLRATVSLHRSSLLARQLVYVAAWPSSGTHTIQIKVLGTAGHPRIDVDAFAILR